MKCSKTDIAKQKQNYFGFICLLLSKINVAEGGEEDTVDVCTSATRRGKPSLVLGQTGTKALNCV
jgi:hypothetical protein